MREANLGLALAVAARVARIRVKAAIRTRAVPSADRDDVVQELLIACWRAAASFDPGRASPQTFFGCVIASRLASAIRTARRRPAVLRLESVEEFGIAPMTETLDVRLDVARVLDQLDTADRRVAVALMEYSPTEASRQLGLARSSVYERVGRLRTRFVAAGIKPSPMARIRC